jgi:putative polyhydroxyalkanoate system protein
MSDIIIRRKHEKTHAEARATAENMICELKKELDINYAWDGDVLRFQRPGVSGELALENQEIILCIRLGLLLSALKPSIELEVNTFLDQAFAPREARPHT